MRVVTVSPMLIGCPVLSLTVLEDMVGMVKSKVRFLDEVGRIILYRRADVMFIIRAPILHSARGGPPYARSKREQDS